MNERVNRVMTRGFLLAGILVLTVSLAGCGLYRSLLGEGDTMSEAEAAPMMEGEETMMAPPEEMAPLVVSDDIHFVSTGESLWLISGLSSIYNDPFRWPIIYARNKQISHADMIFPGQELAIRRDLTRSDIDAAVTHAKQRGVRSMEDLMAYDEAYIASMMMQ